MERNVEMAKALIKFFNSQAGSSVSSVAKGNQETVFVCLDRVNQDAIAVKNHIRQWVRNNKDEDSNLGMRFEECFETIEVPNENKGGTGDAFGDSLNLITQTVANVVVNTRAEEIKKEIMDDIRADVSDFVAKEYGPIERKITITVNDHKAEMKGVLHEKFDDVLAFVASNEPVYLAGPAGSGKNVICQQVADALGLKFYFTNAVTQEYKLTGFTDAMGKYQPTQFYKAFSEGGLFMLDEMDASIPETLIILNAAISNGYFDFPAPIGFVKAHPDFRIIAAGNTTGHGADYVYVGRNQQDGSNLDRFGEIDVDYSPAIENDKAGGDLELANFCREFRAAAKKVGVNILVSYRAIGRLAKMIPLLGLEKALKSCLIKDLEKDDLNIITNELAQSKFKSALRNLCASM